MSKSINEVNNNPQYCADNINWLVGQETHQEKWKEIIRNTSEVRKWKTQKVSKEKEKLDLTPILDRGDYQDNQKGDPINNRRGENNNKSSTMFMLELLRKMNRALLNSSLSTHEKPTDHCLKVVASWISDIF
jgi:hypothetical protein